MHKDLPKIISSFKQEFATITKFVVSEERDKGINDELTQRKMSETQKIMRLNCCLFKSKRGNILQKP